MRPISVNGHAIQIRGNLHDALVALRTDHRDVHLWADALCINQADEKEKGDQVSLMGQIYQTATLTVIWLGHPPPRQDLADARSDASVEKILFALVVLFYIYPDAKVYLRAMSMRTAVLLHPVDQPVTIVVDRQTLGRRSARCVPDSFIQDRAIGVLGSAIKKGLLPRIWDEFIQPASLPQNLDDAVRGTTYAFQINYLRPGYQSVPDAPYVDPRKLSGQIRGSDPLFGAINRHILSILALEDSILRLTHPAGDQNIDQKSSLLGEFDFDEFFSRAFRNTSLRPDFHVLGALSILHQTTSERHLHQLPFSSPGTRNIVHYPSRLWVHSIRALVDFFGREYWRRIWILQEVALSRNVHIVYGRYTVPFSVVENWVVAFKTHDSTCCGSTISPSWLSEVASLSSHASYISGCRAHVRLGMPRPLSTLFPPNLLPFGATDPRDHIYAVPGLIEGGGGCQIVPDYSQSVQDVFIDAAREMIRTTNQVDVLHLKGVLGSGRSGILPS